MYIQSQPKSTLMCEIRVNQRRNTKHILNQKYVETKPKMRTKTRLEYIIRNNRKRASIRLSNFSWHTKYLYNIYDNMEV